MANLIQTQKACDKKKYLESIKEGRDMSGAMDYCLCCVHSTKDYTCDVNHQQRIASNYCAKAYNKCHRKK